MICHGTLRSCRPTINPTQPLPQLHIPAYQQEYASMWLPSFPSKHAVFSLNFTRPSRRRRRRVRPALQLERLEDRQLLVVSVLNWAVTASISGPSSGTVETSLSYTASATEANPAVQAAGFAYAWNFGDGGTGRGATASHSFAFAGTYTVTVTARDEYGRTGAATEA